MKFLQGGGEVAAQRMTFTDRRVLLPWYAAEFLNSFAMVLATNGVFFFARYELHCAAATLLWVMVGGGFLYKVAALAGGKILARVGQRKLLMTTGVGTGLICLIGVAAVDYRSVALLFLLVALLNVSVTPGWPALESAITQSPARMKLSTRITLYNLGWSNSYFLALLVTGILAQWLTWPAVFITAGLAAVTSAMIVRFAAIPQNLIGSRPVHHDEVNPADAALIGSARGSALLNMARLSNLLAYVSLNSIMPIMAYLTYRTGFSYAQATAVGSIWGLARIVGFIGCWFWTGWHYRVRWMLGGFFCLLGATVMLIAVPSIGVLIGGQIILGLAAALVYAGSLYYSMHLSHGSGEHAGLHEALIGVGTVVGPAVAALAGGPEDLLPKGIALGVILLLGGSLLVRMGSRAAGVTAPGLAAKLNLKRSP